MENLVEALKRKQEEMGMTQYAFAKHLGVSSAYLSEIYTGKKPLRANKMVRCIIALYPDMASLFFSPNVAEATDVSSEQQ